MLSVTTRQGQTSRGFLIFEPWIDEKCKYSVMQLIHGSNLIQNLEIVSALNSFNLSSYMFMYGYGACTEKYNPKVYLGTVQSVSNRWNYDYQDPQKVHPFWVSDGYEKSGS